MHIDENITIRRAQTFKTIPLKKVKFQPLFTASSEQCLDSVKVSYSSKDKDTKEFNKLKDKLAEKENMKAVSRGFNKSFYGKLATRIKEKPKTFYKFGLKEAEKKNFKTIFKEIFNVQSSDLRGTLSVGQLWSNKNSLRYLKENKMFFNKEALIHQFEDMDKKVKENKKMMKQRKQKEVVKQYRRALKIQYLPSRNKSLDRTQNPHKTLNEIKKNIDELRKVKTRTNSRRMIRDLEKDFDKMDNLREKYNQQMIIWV